MNTLVIMECVLPNGKTSFHKRDYSIKEEEQVKFMYETIPMYNGGPLVTLVRKNHSIFYHYYNYVTPHTSP